MVKIKLIFPILYRKEEILELALDIKDMVFMLIFRRISD